MSTFGIIAVFVPIIIGLIIGAFIEDLNPRFFNSLSGGFVGAFIGLVVWFAGVLLVNLDMIEKQHATYEIISMKDTKASKGPFILASGTQRSSIYYYMYIKKPSDNITFYEIYAKNKAEICLEEGIPYLEIFGTYVDSSSKKNKFFRPKRLGEFIALTLVFIIVPFVLLTVGILKEKKEKNT